MSPVDRLMTAARSHALAGVVLVVCLAATALMAVQVHQTTTAKDAIRFNITVERVRDDITRRLGNYVAILRAGAGLVAAQPDLDRAQFRAFVDRLELQSRYPGIQGIGYSRRLRSAELGPFVAAERARDPHFRVWPEAPREQYHAIVFLEPLDRRNRAAIGYDMFTEPVRREAMARARDTGLPAASGRVTLVQEIDPEKQAGFLIYVPVYDGGDVPPSVEERRARLRGFIYSPFRVGDLLKGIFGTEEEPRVGFELYDERDESGRLIFHSAGYNPHARFSGRQAIEVAGRSWVIKLTGTPALEDASSRSLVPVVLVIGVTISLLLSALTALQTRARRRLERSEAELSETSQRFQQLADTIPQLVWMARPDGWIYWYNRRWYEYTGTTPKESEGWGWKRAHDPAMLPEVVKHWQRSIATGETFEMEFPLRSATGEMRWFLTRVVAIRNARGEVTRWFGTNTDVQSRRDAERQLEELIERERTLRAEAERVSRIKDEFLATLSHELRTPLNAIIGWNHLLLDGGLGAEAERRALATVHRNAKQQARLIDDLLDMSRIVSGKVHLDAREVDLNDVVEAAINVVRPAATANTITIEAALDRGAPRVWGDPGRLQQVLWNLLSNAVKFTPEGGRVRVAVHHDEREVRLSVTDTGVGLDPSFLPFAFDRFRQADGSSTRVHGGLGLGLSIVKSLVEMHGGRVQAASEGRGQGATFTVALRPAPVAGAYAANPPAGGVQGRAAHLAGARVLLVENDPDARDLERVILESAGAQVLATESADEALIHLAQADQPFDLLVSDLAMPGIDGFELMRRVRATPFEPARQMPAIAVSAYAHSDDRAAAKACGFDAYLAKPFQPGDLVASCAALLEETRRDTAGRTLNTGGGSP